VIDGMILRAESPQIVRRLTKINVGICVFWFKKEKFVTGFFHKTWI
jgi:hypothetical protein